MAKLTQKNTVPPGGFYYLQPESRLRIDGESLGDLLRQVILHRQHKGFEPRDPDTVQAEIERQICGRLGREQCRPEGRDDDWVPVSADSDVMSLDKIRSFSSAAWEWLKSGGKLVDMAEAERRRAICAACPANADTGRDCFNCSLGKLIRLAVPADRRFQDLRVCSYCGCDLRSKVNVPDSVIVVSDQGRGIAYPKHCWQREILASHQGNSQKTEV